MFAALEPEQADCPSEMSLFITVCNRIEVWRGAAPNFKGTSRHDVLSQSPDLAKLNRLSKGSVVCNVNAQVLAKFIVHLIWKR